MIGSKLLLMILASGLAAAATVDLASKATAQTRHRARASSICGNPTVRCRSSETFGPNDLPFRVPKNAVIYDTELFYAIILKSVGIKGEDCNVFVAEQERIAAQALFPQHKVFTTRCADPGEPESGMLFYTNVDPKFRIMAVYAGATLVEARRLLESVKATGKFPGASIRRMRAGFNST